MELEAPGIPVVQSLLEILLHWLRDKPFQGWENVENLLEGWGFATANDLSRLLTDSVHHCCNYRFG